MRAYLRLNSRVVVCLLTAVVVLAFSTPLCLADLSDNDLDSGFIDNDVQGGLSASGAWDEGLTSLAWDITPGAGVYHYSYTFTAPEKALSHFILSVSDTFTRSDISSVDPSALVLELGEFGDAPSNPGIPGTIGNGIKFENFDEDTTWTWSFDSPRIPVWGDFYAVDGKSTAHGAVIPYAYNTGFGMEPPITFEHPDGRLAWIARPDTTVVPTPTAVLLGLLGLSAAGVKLRKYV